MFSLTPFFNMSPTPSALCGAKQNEGTTSPVKLLRLLSSARTRALPRLLFHTTPVPQCVCALEQMHMEGTLRSDCHKLWQCCLLLVSVGVLSWASPSDLGAERRCLVMLHATFEVNGLLVG